MDAVLRACFFYLFLLLLFRVAGKRTFEEMTNFDFVLLLIISEATQQGLSGNDYSMATSVILICTLVGIDVAFSLWKRRSKTVEKWVDGLPVVLVENGRPVQEVMAKSRVDLDEVLAQARQSQGLERLEQIKYAVLETNGGISIVPVENPQGGRQAA